MLKKIKYIQVVQFCLINEKKKIFQLIQKNGQNTPFTLGLFDEIQQEHDIPLRSFRSGVGKMISKIPGMKKTRGVNFIWYKLCDAEFFTKDFSSLDSFDNANKKQDKTQPKTNTKVKTTQIPPVVRTSYSLIIEKKRIHELIQQNGLNNPFDTELFNELKEKHNIPEKSFKSSIGRILTRMPLIQKKRTYSCTWYVVKDPGFFEVDLSTKVDI